MRYLKNKEILQVSAGLGQVWPINITLTQDNLFGMLLPGITLQIHSNSKFYISEGFFGEPWEISPELASILVVVLAPDDISFG